MGIDSQLIVRRVKNRNLFESSSTFRRISSLFKYEKLIVQLLATMKVFSVSEVEILFQILFEKIKIGRIQTEEYNIHRRILINSIISKILI